MYTCTVYVMVVCNHAAFCTQPPLPVEVLMAIDKCYGFNKSKNAEIKYRYTACSAIGWSVYTCLMMYAEGILPIITLWGIS